MSEQDKNTLLLCQQDLWDYPLQLETLMRPQVLVSGQLIFFMIDPVENPLKNNR